MMKQTKKVKVDIGEQIVDRLPGVFRRSLTVDARTAALELGEASHSYVLSFSGALRWAGLVRAVWPQICVCGYRGLTDREMAPIISVGVQLGRPDIELWNAGPKRLEERRIELSPGVLRDAISAERKRAPIPMQQTAVWWLARQRGVDVAVIDPAIAAEMEVLRARAQAGIAAPEAGPVSRIVAVQAGSSTRRRSPKKSELSNGDGPLPVKIATSGSPGVGDDIEPVPEGFGDDVDEGGGWRPSSAMLEQAAQELPREESQTRRMEVDESVFDQLRPAGR